MILLEVYLVVAGDCWAISCLDCEINSVSGSINDQKILDCVEARGAPESPKLLSLFSPEEKKQDGGMK